MSEVLKAAVHNVFKDGLPGRDWMRSYLGRHPNVSEVASNSLEAVRAAATDPENLARMMALLKLVRVKKGITAANVFNADESGFSTKDLLSSSRKRPLAPSGTSTAKVILPCVSDDAQFLTLLPIIAADGDQLPPTFIVKGSPNNPKRRRNAERGDGAWQFLNDVAPPNSIFLYKTPAGMDGNTWTKWCIFLATRVFSTLRPSEAKILIIDGCRAHLGYEALAALARVNVEVFVLPANTTHATQQLDVTLFQPLKREAKDLLSKATREMNVINHKSAKLGIFEVVACEGKAYEKVFTPTLIRAAFRTTGVEPWNPEMLEKHTALSDSDKRKRKRKQTLTLLAARLAPAVASGIHDLTWERGTMKTTQAVFMDEDNRKWLAKKQDDRAAAEAAKEEAKRQRSAAAAQRKEQAAKAALERLERMRVVKERKVVEAAALEAKRVARGEKQAAARAAKELPQHARERKRLEARVCQRQGAVPAPASGAARARAASEGLAAAAVAAAALASALDTAGSGPADGLASTSARAPIPTPSKKARTGARANPASGAPTLRPAPPQAGHVAAPVVPANETTGASSPPTRPAKKVRRTPTSTRRAPSPRLPPRRDARRSTRGTPAPPPPPLGDARRSNLAVPALVSALAATTAPGQPSAAATTTSSIAAATITSQPPTGGRIAAARPRRGGR